MRINLPTGGWAELRAIQEITERNRRPIATAISQLSQAAQDMMTKLAPFLTDGAKSKLNIEEIAKLGITFSADDLQHFTDANDFCVAAMVKTWSYSAPITVESIIDLPAVDYDALREACAPASASLFVDFSMTKESVADVTSPFDHSSESSTTSPVDSSSTSAFPSPSIASTASSS